MSFSIEDGIIGRQVHPLKYIHVHFQIHKTKIGNSTFAWLILEYAYKRICILNLLTFLQNLFQYVDLKYLRPWFMRNASDQQAIDETVLMVYRKLSSRYESVSINV
jgi:hypothetical protein